jgi:hypothetical protein
MIKAFFLMVFKDFLLADHELSSALTKALISIFDLRCYENGIGHAGIRKPTGKVEKWRE